MIGRKKRRPLDTCLPLQYFHVLKLYFYEDIYYKAAMFLNAPMPTFYLKGILLTGPAFDWLQVHLLFLI